MKLKLFNLRFDSETDGFDDAEMRKFLHDKTVSTIYQYTYEHHSRPHWSLLVKYIEKVDAGQKDVSERVDKGMAPPTTDARKESPSAGPAETRTGARPPAIPLNEPAPARAAQKDYLNELTPEQREVFERLRRWRMGQSRSLGAPPYTICLDKELVAVVRAMPTDFASLMAVQGLRPVVTQKYAKELLQALHEPRNSGSQSASFALNGPIAGSYDGSWQGVRSQKSEVRS